MRFGALLAIGLTAGMVRAQPPETAGVGITAFDVRNAANGARGAVTPGEIVVLFPSGAGPMEFVPWGLEGNLKETTTIGETRVLFDGVAVPIMYSVRGQIGAFVPDAVAGRESTTVVVEYQGRRSPPVALKVIPTAPAIFTLDSTGKGQAAMLNDTGCCNSVRNPAVLGSMASLFATGEGILEPGEAEKAVRVRVGGVSAPVTFTRRNSVFQVNFRVPPGAPVGDAAPLELIVRGKPSSPGVTMAVRSSTQTVLLAGAPSTMAGLARMLENNGYRIVLSGGLEDAVSRAGQHPDLLIVDADVPFGRALEALPAMRAANPFLRTLAVVGDRSPETLRRADLLDAQGVLTKPVAAGKALPLVQRMLRRRPAVY
ncbi:MAG: hypothetical protein R2729_17820 [Bryobacteraceae bacterium]